MSYTNTALSTFRRCPTEYDFGYHQQLAPLADDSEALQVGQVWHKAHDVHTKRGNPYEVITRAAPGLLWAEKLRRLFAAYQGYWANDPIEVEESERTFAFWHNGRQYEGQLDGTLRQGVRRGMLERKTAGEDISPSAKYWDRLRLDPQTGMYSLALDFLPSFIVYDVVRKPTINPKSISKKDATRLRSELDSKGTATYYCQEFEALEVEAALVDGRETIALYGARLTADIGDQPEKYFQRRPVDRTAGDYKALVSNLEAEAAVIEFSLENDLMFQNPDSCKAFGSCRFWLLCSNNIRPKAGDPAPDGYRRRKHLHPELVPLEEA